MESESEIPRRPKWYIRWQRSRFNIDILDPNDDTGADAEEKTEGLVDFARKLDVRAHRDDPYRESANPAIAATSTIDPG